MPHLSSQPGADPIAKLLRDVGSEFADLGRELDCVTEILLLLALVVECFKSKLDAAERKEIEEEILKLAGRASELRGEVEQPPTIASVLAEALELSKKVRKAVK